MKRELSYVRLGPKQSQPAAYQDILDLLTIEKLLSGWVEQRTCHKTKQKANFPMFLLLDTLGTPVHLSLKSIK